MEGKWGQERSCGGITRLAWQTFDPSTEEFITDRIPPPNRPCYRPRCVLPRMPRVDFFIRRGRRCFSIAGLRSRTSEFSCKYRKWESTWRRDRCVQVVLEFQSVVNTRGKLGGRAIEAVGKFLSLVEINRWFNHCLEFAGTKLYCSRADTKELAERKFSVTNVSWAESWFIKN